MNTPEQNIERLDQLLGIAIALESVSEYAKSETQDHVRWAIRRYAEKIWVDSLHD